MGRLDLLAARASATAFSSARTFQARGDQLAVGADQERPVGVSSRHSRSTIGSSPRSRSRACGQERPLDWMTRLAVLGVVGQAEADHRETPVLAEPVVDGLQRCRRPRMPRMRHPEVEQDRLAPQAWRGSRRGLERLDREGRGRPAGRGRSPAACAASKVNSAEPPSGRLIRWSLAERRVAPFPGGDLILMVGHEAPAAIPPVRLSDEDFPVVLRHSR